VPGHRVITIYAQAGAKPQKGYMAKLLCVEYTGECSLLGFRGERLVERKDRTTVVSDFEAPGVPDVVKGLAALGYDVYTKSLGDNMFRVVGRG
jgi:hypothetical protein